VAFAAVLAAVFEWLIRLCMLAFDDVRERLVADRRRPGTEGPEGATPERRVTGFSLRRSTATRILTLVDKGDSPGFGGVFADVLSLALRHDETDMSTTHGETLLPVALPRFGLHGERGVDSIRGGLDVPFLSAHIACLSTTTYKG